MNLGNGPDPSNDQMVDDEDDLVSPDHFYNPVIQKYQNSDELNNSVYQNQQLHLHLQNSGQTSYENLRKQNAYIPDQ